MSLVDGMALGADTITVMREGEPTQDGDGYEVPGEMSSWDVPGCSMQSLTSRNAAVEEDTITADLLTTRYRLFAPFGTDLVASDRVRFKANVYAVDGDVSDWEPDEFGDGHRECYLKRWAG